MTYRLSNSLPYLIVRLGIRARDLFGEIAQTYGLTVHSFRVLAALIEEERPLRLYELSTLTAIDLSTLSRLVAAMHRKGLLRRDRPENDRRSLQLIPTEYGRSLAIRLIPIAAHFEEIQVSGLTPREVTALKATLKQLYRNADRLEEKLTNQRFPVLADALEDKFASLYDPGK
jgi:MarR family transcriptional regulator, organic hydroperoxide resistance regulator